MSPANSPSSSDAGGVGAARAATGTERHPETQAIHPAGQGHPLRVGLANICRRPCSPAQVAEHFWIGIELDLQVEMAVGQRDQQEAGCPQHGPRYLADRKPAPAAQPLLAHAALHPSHDAWVDTSQHDAVS
jgi:hypothetical protein